MPLAKKKAFFLCHGTSNKSTPCLAVCAAVWGEEGQGGTRAPVASLSALWAALAETSKSPSPLYPPAVMNVLITLPITPGFPKKVLVWCASRRRHTRFSIYEEAETWKSEQETGSSPSG